MPRGVKGSGPYSKVNPDGSPKVKGEVTNDLAAPLKSTASTKASARTTANTKKSTAAAKRPARKAVTPTPANVSASNGNGNGNGHVQTVTAITIDASGQIQFVGESGGIQKLQLADPTYLLKLEGKVKEATDQYVRDLAASRS